MALRGENRILYMKINDDWVPFACLTSNSFNETAEELDTTTRDTGGWRTFTLTTQSYSIPFTGIQINSDGLTNQISYDRLKALKRSKSQIIWKLEETTEQLEDQGTAYITELSESAEAGGYLTFEGTLQGYGIPTQATAPGAPIDDLAPEAPVLDPTTFLSAGGVVGAVILNWNEPFDDIGVTGYELRILGPGGSERIETITGQTRYVDSGINQGSQYAYNVRAFDVSGNRSGYSNKRLVTVPIPPGVPDQTTGVIYQDGVEIITQTGSALILQ